MKRLALILMLAIHDPSWAGWTPVADEGNATLYADAASREPGTGTVRMLWVLDYHAFQRMVEVGYHSRRTVSEFDCTQSRWRAIDLSLRAEHMGEGTAVYADTSPHDWEAIDPGSRGDLLRAVACRR